MDRPARTLLAQTVYGPCPHTCNHRLRRFAAFGPDGDPHSLEECTEVDGCAGRCRGWGEPAEAGRYHPPTEWFQVRR
jgi:hypothetical protein